MNRGQVKPGVKVRHWKGGLFEIVGKCIIESPRCIGVIHRSIDGRYDLPMVRPIEDGSAPFCGEAVPGVERFTEIEK